MTELKKKKKSENQKKMQRPVHWLQKLIWSVIIIRNTANRGNKDGICRI